MLRLSLLTLIAAHTVCSPAKGGETEDMVRSFLDREIASAKQGLSTNNIVYTWTVENRVMPSEVELAVIRREAAQNGPSSEVNRKRIAAYDRRDYPVTQQRLWSFGEQRWRHAIENPFDSAGWSDSAVNGSISWRLGADHVDELDIATPRAGYDNALLRKSSLSDLSSFRFYGLEAAVGAGIADARTFQIEIVDSSDCTVKFIGTRNGTEYKLHGKWISGSKRLQPDVLTITPNISSVVPSTVTFLDWRYEEALGSWCSHERQHRRNGPTLTRVVKLLRVEDSSGVNAEGMLKMPLPGQVDPIRGDLQIKYVNTIVGDSTATKYLNADGTTVEILAAVDPAIENSRMLASTGRWIAGGITVAVIIFIWKVMPLTRKKGLQQ